MVDHWTAQRTVLPYEEVADKNVVCCPFERMMSRILHVTDFHANTLCEDVHHIVTYASNTCVFCKQTIEAVSAFLRA
jgi:hypothetical protein